MMHDGARHESHLAAARDNAREQFGILARNRISADHPEVLAETSEALESRAPETDVGAEIIFQRLRRWLWPRLDRRTIVDCELDPQARSQPARRRVTPSRLHHPAGRVERAILHRSKHCGEPFTIGGRVVIEKENKIAARFVDGAVSRKA